MRTSLRRLLPVRWVSTAALVALTVGLAGCGAGGADTTAAGVSGSGSAAATAAGFPRTVEHAMGSTTIDKQPQRVAALDASFVDAAIALQTQVVAYTSYRSIKDTLPAYLGADAQTYGKDAVSVGTLTSPSVEQILATEPDLIVSAKVRHESLYTQLSAQVPTVFTTSTGPTWKENIRLLARALGKEDLAEQKIGDYERRAQRVGDAIRAKLGKNPTVSVVRFTDEQTVRLYTPHSFSGIVLADAGLARTPAAQTDDPAKIAVDLSPERITDLDADQIFVSTWQDEKGDSARQRDSFQANPLWGQLTGATRDVDDTTWMTAVGLQGAHVILDDLAATFGVDPARS
ncbi:ABC transporter substrate-binding protein [Goodfellowiella coeruleoviolacea]|uniref:Iron complex transport system substrate-binding protein n=1 Tax=Goodfellowiella coeruleoviolacea TaxID=334858 RepID=A0AAE3GFY9_9PSEU|nr:iron-siderophore ABC transporter substrate-binding protein [Goodfellowiella coeruleoviolacea]MCP2167506.1 iron complex transport system substrate-binding protein [Goodfellowiella coeruleoviolacea]